MIIMLIVDLINAERQACVYINDYITKELFFDGIEKSDIPYLVKYNDYVREGAFEAAITCWRNYASSHIDDLRSWSIKEIPLFAQANNLSSFTDGIFAK